MKEAPIPKNEKARLAALRRINLSQLSRANLDRITRIATNLFHVPISTVTFVDYKKEKHFSVCGLTKRDGPRAVSFCGHAIAGKEDLMIVPDTLKDWRFRDNPMVVRGPKLRFYAAVVLKSLDGYNVGTLCIKDRVPRALTKKQVNLLKDLGAWAQKELNYTDVVKLNAELNKAEEALRENAAEVQESRDARKAAEYVRSLIEASLDPLVTIDPEGRITDGNAAAAKFRGVSKKELLGSHFSSYFTEPGKARKAYRQAFKNGSVSDYPLTLRRRDGRLINALYNISAYRDTEGKVIGVFATARDITKLEKVEEDLEKSQQLLAETEIMGRVGGWEFDMDTGKLKWTNETYRIHELDPSRKLTVKDGIGFYTPASRPIIAQAVQNAVDHGAPFDVKLEIITAKGNLRSVHAIGKADLKERRVHGFFQDITAETKAEKATEKHAEELEKLNRIMVGRELRMVELKQEIAGLKSQLQPKQADEKAAPA